MKFFAVNGTRPVRLSESTRGYAFDSINGKFGREALENYAVQMDDVADFEKMDNLDKYDAIVRRIASNAPLRICENERISGAATLGLAISHVVPATYKGDKIFYSISHLTVGFERAVKKGIYDIKKQAQDRLEEEKDKEKARFLKSVINTVDSMEIWHGRYLDALKGEKRELLERVPFYPATSFKEAVQALWFTFAYLRLMGTWTGIGRIDHILGDYLENDLKAGQITVDEAREYLAHLFIKGCEWIHGLERGTGDAQHYQNIVLAGVDEDGNEITNTVTYLVLDIIEETGISDFPVTVRVNKNTPEKLLKRVAEVIRFGGGVIAVYNEDLILESLVNAGYDLREARKFANDGCWEVQIPGKTYFSYNPFDSLQILQRHTLNGYEECEFDSFDEMFNKFLNDLERDVESTCNLICQRIKDMSQKPEERVFVSDTPCTVVGMLEEGCIEKGLSYLEGGPVYKVVSPHIGGLPDTSNALYAIKKLVFDDKLITFKELMLALKNNWEGYEELRQKALRYKYFGNDNDEVDNIAARIIDAFAEYCDKTDTYPIKTPAGVSTFGRQIEWSPSRLATPQGKKAGAVLAPNFSPAPGTDSAGATAVIRSYCKTDLKKCVSGAALDIKLMPGAVSGENGIEAIVGLIKGFLRLGGHFMQLDISDVELLRAAQENPEEYANLSVRVSGWNARFVTLNEEWQNMIINQTAGEI